MTSGKSSIVTVSFHCWSSGGVLVSRFAFLVSRVSTAILDLTGFPGFAKCSAQDRRLSVLTQYSENGLEGDALPSPQFRNLAAILAEVIPAEWAGLALNAAIFTALARGDLKTKLRSPGYGGGRPPGDFGISLSCVT